MILYGPCEDGLFRVRRNGGPFIKHAVFDNLEAAQAQAKRFAGPYGRALFAIFGTPKPAEPDPEPEVDPADDDTLDWALEPDDTEE